MLMSFLKFNRTAALTAGIMVWSVGGFAMNARAQSCCEHGSMQHDGEHAVGQHASAGNSAADTPTTSQPPHDGQVTKAESSAFEVVYHPQEIRVYLYGILPYATSAKEVRGEVALQVRGNPQVFRYPLRYVPSPAGSNEQDYLAAAVDLTHVRDGDMQATFNLENLPIANRPKLSFTQAFALSKTKPQVVLAALEEGDREGVARQKVCPVTGAALGSMGNPIKVLIDGQPLFLCCKGCVAKVKKDPAAFLPKKSPQVTRVALAAADKEAIARQSVCPVTGEPLGNMGEPIKVLIDGKPLFLCCPGCLGKVQSDPLAYLQKASRTSENR